VKRLLAGRGFHLPADPLSPSYGVKRMQFWWGAHLGRFLTFARERGEKILLVALVTDYPVALNQEAPPNTAHGFLASE
jgi:hypothetical protein